MASLAVKGIMLSRQKELPKLPVPPLKETLERLWLSLQPILSEQELDASRKAIDKLGERGGEGEYLHRMLTYRYKRLDNWLDEWWLNTAYLDVRTPLPVHSSPAALFPRQTFTSEEDFLLFAAKMTAAVLEFKDLIDRQALLPDTTRHIPLDMTMYFKIFSMHRVPKPGRDELVSYLDDAHPPRHIVVMHNHHATVPGERVQWPQAVQGARPVPAAGVRGQRVALGGAACRRAHHRKPGLVDGGLPATRRRRHQRAELGCGAAQHPGAVPGRGGRREGTVGGALPTAHARRRRKRPVRRKPLVRQDCTDHRGRRGRGRHRHGARAHRRHGHGSPHGLLLHIHEEDVEAQARPSDLPRRQAFKVGVQPQRGEPAGHRCSQDQNGRVGTRRGRHRPPVRAVRQGLRQVVPDEPRQLHPDGLPAVLLPTARPQPGDVRECVDAHVPAGAHRSHPVAVQGERQVLPRVPERKAQRGRARRPTQERRRRPQGLRIARYVRPRSGSSSPRFQKSRGGNESTAAGTLQGPRLHQEYHLRVIHQPGVGAQRNPHDLRLLGARGLRHLLQQPMQPVPLQHLYSSLQQGGVGSEISRRAGDHAQGVRQQPDRAAEGQALKTCTSTAKPDELGPIATNVGR
ncbi:uncharacterized protein [Dermacentor albipictus]|uniref:uncharacterized protein isoform X1 n=1 Tax=Dermacentor albipictus TaxID=60249 RepID=UPI0038FC58CD